MRVAILSDIHANRHALEAVAKDLEDARVDQVWCLGDVVGYGAHPREVLEWVAEHATVVVQGNHDHAVATGDVTGFNPVAAAAARYHAQLLTPPERARLHDLPAQAKPRAGMLLVHGSPDSPLHEYVLPSVARARLPQWASVADVILLGHTHVPFAARLEPDAPTGWTPLSFRESLHDSRIDARPLLVMNPGSVGQPRDADPRASYAILDDGPRRVELRRVPYDVDAAAMAIRRAGLDAFLAQRLYRGV